MKHNDKIWVHKYRYQDKKNNNALRAISVYTFLSRKFCVLCSQCEKIVVASLKISVQKIVMRDYKYLL